MKTILLILTCLIVSFRAFCQDQYFTVQTPDHVGYFPVATSFLTLNAGQAVAIVSLLTPNNTTGQSPILIVATSAATNNYSWLGQVSTSPPPPSFANPLVIAGPASLTLVGGTVSSGYFCTYKFLSTTFDPNKTLILPPGTNMVNVTMQSSTNLLNWVTATNGLYGSTNTAMFFRVSLQSGQ